MNSIEIEYIKPNLYNLTVVELKSMCKNRGLKNYSNLKKSELIELLEDAEG